MLNGRAVKIVKIPCDSRLDCQEINLDLPDDDENAGDQLLSVLRIYFKGTLCYFELELHIEFNFRFFVGSSSDFNMKLLQETASKQFASNSSAIVSEDTVQKLGEMGSVEAFTLSQFHFDSTVKDWNKKVAAESKSTQ
jgi:hypothetical protein